MYPKQLNPPHVLRGSLYTTRSQLNKVSSSLVLGSGRKKRKNTCTWINQVIPMKRNPFEVICQQKHASAGGVEWIPN